MSFIPLNGASCLQLDGVCMVCLAGGFIPLNGASCLQHDLCLSAVQRLVSFP